MPSLAPALFWAALIFAFVMAILPNPIEIEVNDKVEHMGAFAVLAGLGAVAYPRVSLIRITILLAGFGILIELTQTIPALHRDPAFTDWVADFVAIAAVLSAVAIQRGIANSGARQPDGDSVRPWL